MANSSVEFELIAEVKKATAAVDRFAKDTQKQLDSINTKSTFTSIATSFLAIKEAVAPVFGAISGFLADATAEALEAERANIQLAQSLKLVGDFSEEALQSFSDFADEIARTTTLQDDQVISAAALAKTYRLTNQEAKNVVRAAIELSAATGDSLNSSVEKVAKTFNGFISKELKQLVPELKGLTEAQLQSGEAARILEQRFAGSAAAIRNTAGGSLTGVSNAFGELQEAIGNTIIKNDFFIKSNNSVTDSLNSITDSIKRGGLAGAYNDFFQNLDKISIPVLLGLRKSIQEIKRIEAEANKSNTSLLTDLEKQRLKNTQTTAEKQIQQVRKLQSDREKAEKDFQSIRASIENAGLDEIEKVNKEAFDKINKLRAAEKAGIDLEGINVAKTISAIEQDRENKVLEIIKKQNAEREASNAKIRQEIEAAAANPIKALFEFSGKLDSKTGAAIGAGLLSNVTKGAAGAQKLITDTLGAAANAILPGIGGAVSEIASLLGQGPEAVKETISQFASAIPTFIQNIVESLPILISELASKLPPALAKTFPFLAQKFSIELVKNIPTIVQGFVTGLVDAAKQFVQTLIDTVKDGINVFDGGEDGGLFGNGGFLGTGLAEGGRVPDISKFGGDRFPARLDRGEQVFSRDLSKDLENFLKQPTASGGSQPPIQVNLQIGLQQFAKVMLEADRLGYRVRTT